MKSNHKVVFGNAKFMNLLEDQSIHLIITSPPYWNLKDYKDLDQIGYDQSFKEYLKELFSVFDECNRVLKYGCYFCINIGNVFTRTKEYGRYRTISLSSHIILYLEKIGFDLRTEIIWHKITTTNTSGGCSLMGSIYFPRNPIPTQEHEFILVFKKRTPKEMRRYKPKNPKGETKELSRIEKQEFFSYMRAFWEIKPEKQKEHPAQFPLELPLRLIKMYSFYGENVLDCFLGSGTTTLASIVLNRNSYGYELNSDYKPTIEKKIKEHNISNNYKLEFVYQDLIKEYSKSDK